MVLVPEPPVVQPGPWSGTAEQLLQQITRTPTIGTSAEDKVRLVGDPVPITTHGGDSGAEQGFTTARGTGIAAAYVFGDEGVLIEVLGPPEQVTQHSPEIEDMIASFDHEDAA